MPSSLENQKAAVAALLAAEEAWDIDAILALRTPDAVYNLLPANIGGPPRNNDESRDFLSSLKPLWSNYKILKKTEFHDVEGHKAAVQTLSTANTPVGPFETEAIWLLTFNEDGSKIRAVDEMADSKALTDLLAKIAELQRAG